jgi:hypothetical protein
MNDDISNPIKQAMLDGEILKKQEYEIRKGKAESEFDNLKSRQERKKAFSNLPIGQNIEFRAAERIKENEEYIRLAKKSETFLGMDMFKDKIALFPRNIIFIGAETGTGKSTTVANFVESMIKRSKKVLIITNEEYPTDILNRIIFLLRGWAYTDHNDITEEQLAICSQLYPLLMTRIEIINDKFNGVGGTTTTLEGIQAVLTQIADQYRAGADPFNAILIDYVQNIKSSNDYPLLSMWQVLDRLSSFLDGWKATYPAPLLLFSQLKENSGDERFKDRIEGLKAMVNCATTAIEVKVDRENLRTEWVFRKNRFKGAIGISVFTGYDKGRYVAYDQNFKSKIQEYRAKKSQNELMGKVWNKGS